MHLGTCVRAQSPAAVAVTGMTICKLNVILYTVMKLKHEVLLSAHSDTKKHTDKLLPGECNAGAFWCVSISDPVYVQLPSLSAPRSRFLSMADVARFFLKIDPIPHRPACSAAEIER